MYKLEKLYWRHRYLTIHFKMILYLLMLYSERTVLQIFFKSVMFLGFPLFKYLGLPTIYHSSVWAMDATTEDFINFGNNCTTDSCNHGGFPLNSVRIVLRLFTILDVMDSDKRCRGFQHWMRPECSVRRSPLLFTFQPVFFPWCSRNFIVESVGRKGGGDTKKSFSLVQILNFLQRRSN